MGDNVIYIRNQGANMARLAYEKYQSYKMNYSHHFFSLYFVMYTSLMDGAKMLNSLSPGLCHVEDWAMTWHQTVPKINLK